VFCCCISFLTLVIWNVRKHFHAVDGRRGQLINIHGLVRSLPQGVAPIGSSCSVVRRSSSLALVAVTCSILAVNVSRVALSKAQTVITSSVTEISRKLTQTYTIVIVKFSLNKKANQGKLLKIMSAAAKLYKYQGNYIKEVQLPRKCAEV